MKLTVSVMRMAKLYLVVNNVDDHPNEKPSNALFEWIKNNLLKSIVDKCHLLDIKNDRVSINLAGCKIAESSNEQLLGTKFDKSR